MTTSFGPVYEVTHSVDREQIGEFDAWLGQHIEDMLQIPGIVRASSYVADDDADGRPRRVASYYFDSDSDLERYLAGPATDMRQEAETRFGGHFTASRRILHEIAFVDGAVPPAQHCLNCDATLSGQYCGDCGQRARSRLISIWELTREAFGDLFELDSRLWRTLIPLTFRPGQLTRDYLEGRRARFMPPFRTYLVLSIFFFLIAFFDPRQQFSLLLEPQATTVEDIEAQQRAAEDIRRDILRELADEGIIAADQPGLLDLPGTADESESPQIGALSTNDRQDSGEKPRGFNLTINSDETSPDCDVGDFEPNDLPAWLATRLTPERVKVICDRVIADNGKAFFDKLLDNVPAALFILIPLMALVLKILYPLSKRYYVEHLLFVVHYHAFFFLVLSVQIIFGRVGAMAGVPEALSTIAVVAVSLYIPVYLYMAMRRVYRQGRILTFAKYLVLVGAYFAGLGSIFLGAALLAALSI